MRSDALNPEPTVLTFAVALRRPVSAKDREELDRILSLTLASLYNQTDGGFRILVASAHTPRLPPFVDDRLELLCVPGFIPKTYTDGYRENGIRRHALAHHFARQGGGYLMFVDHDDFVSRRLVEFVRETRDPNGYVALDGYAFDAKNNRLANYPIEKIATKEFHRFCGTCHILHLAPAEILDKNKDGESFFFRINKFGHPDLADRIALEGRPLRPFPFRAAVYACNIEASLTRAARLKDSNWESWFGKFTQAISANAIVDDASLREEFAIPASYVQTVGSPIALAVAPAPAPTLSVLICTYQRPDGLKRLLEKLVPQAAAAGREIIVVNDGSHDEAYAAIAAEYADKIRYRALKTNVGIAAARNAAAAMAEGDWLVFTDDDCEPPSFWLDWLAARVAEHPELEVVAGATRPLWPERPTFFERVRAVHDLLPRPAMSDGALLFPTANVAIKRATFESLGGFGFPGFNGAGEDTELATRLALRGAASAYDPNWYTHHEISEGFFGLCRRYRRYGLANGRLIRLTTSPIAHDYMQDHWRVGWRTIWGWEYKGRFEIACAVHGKGWRAMLSAALASLVRLAYWLGVKDAFSASGEAA